MPAVCILVFICCGKDCASSKCQRILLVKDLCAIRRFKLSHKKIQILIEEKKSGSIGLESNTCSTSDLLNAKIKTSTAE